MFPNQPPTEPIRAPRGNRLSCKGWHQEAAMRMLMNNLDPEVGERPQDLVVYGGSGKAARNWECYYRIVESLKTLENDETLLVQSGKPVGIFRTHPYAPRVLISNAMLVPAWANWEKFRQLEELGLTMYGQMTAGSWIYIGAQGILQGTYETFAAAGRKHFGGSLRGRLVLTAGLGGMGGAQPLAATMNDGVILAVEVDPARIEKRIKTGYCEVMTANLDEALDLALTAKKLGIPKSIGLVGNAALIHPEILKRGILPDLVTDQTSAHDALNGYVPAGLSLEEARDLRAANPQEYIERAMDSMAVHVQAMLEFQRRGAIVFDYGNNIRAQAVARGVTNAFDFPGFVPAFVRPLFCSGRGPFRWAVLSGDPADIATIDDVVLREFKENASLVRWIQPGPREGPLPGPPRPHLLAGLRRAGPPGGPGQPDGEVGRAQGARRLRARSSGLGLRRLAQPRDGGHARRERRHRRLADPERSAQHGGGRLLGVRPSRRRGRHRILDPRRHGRRGRRDGGDRGAPPARAHDRPGDRHHAPCGRRLSRGGHGSQSERSQDPGPAGLTQPSYSFPPHGGAS